MNYFTSDPHFGHKNIIKYCNRPFESVEEMDKALIDNWNTVVNPDDTVYVLGDFSLRSKSYTLSISKQLKGHKRIVLGNHDRTSRNYWKDMGFEMVYEGVVGLIGVGNYSLSHYPLENPDNPNIHGHIHQLEPNHPYNINISVEKTQYRPLSELEINVLIANRLKEKEGSYEDNRN